jgi:hypothetical protein
MGDDMKVKLTVKHTTNDSPGSWADSKVTFVFVGEREIAIRVEEAIKNALAGVQAGK